MEHPNLTKQNLLDIVKKHEGTYKVEDLVVKLTPGSQNENYTGIIIACDMTAKVNGNNKEYNWIFKLPLAADSDNSRVVMLRHMKVEQKENWMYTRIIPAFHRIIREKGASFKILFASLKFHNIELDADKKVLNSTLTLQNLTRIGYSDAINKKKGLNIHYAKLALSQIAKLHALGYVYIKSFGSIEKGLEKEKHMTRDYFFGAPVKEAKDMLEAQMINIFHVLEASQEPGQDLVGALMASHQKKSVIQQRDELCQPDPKEFNTFCHGDCWFNNMMFYHEKDDQGELHPTKCILIDLAMTKWANPCTDLAYFLFLSTTPQLRRTHIHELLGHYHDTLIRCFAELGEDPALYPYRQLLKDYKKYKLFGLLMALWILPLMLRRKEDAMDWTVFDHVDWNDDKQKAEAMKRVKDLMQKAFRNEPQIKIIMAGSFLELVDDGVFQL